MKKTIAILSAAMLLCAVGCGCGVQGSQQETTESASVTQQAVPAAADEIDEVALPQENVDGSTTKPVIDTTAATTAFQPSPIMQELATIQQVPEETTAPQTQAQTEPEAPAADQPQQEQPAPAETTGTTAKPAETTAKAASAELLESSVLRHTQSGTYTITVSAFGKDHDSRDKVSKIVRGGAAAYLLTFPGSNMTVKVFPSDGKYYMSMSGKVCELTKSQYDHLSSTFNNAFCDFASLRSHYQKTETVREGLRKYTREDFSVGGKAVSLWYSGGALFKLEMDTGDGVESLPTTVTGTADGSYFTLDPSLERVEYADLESAAMTIELFFGT